MELFLKEPTITDKEEVVKMCIEIAYSNDEYKFEGAESLNMVLRFGYEKWLQKCEKDKNIENISTALRSNATHYLLVDEYNRVYGCSTIRHHLKEDSIYTDGNISYLIRPRERKKGYGTLQLKWLLDKARNLGLDEVLAICDENNIGSRKIIEKCFGVSDYSVCSEISNTMRLRYWINTRTLNENNTVKKFK